MDDITPKKSYEHITLGYFTAKTQKANEMRAGILFQSLWRLLTHSLTG